MISLLSAAIIGVCILTGFSWVANQLNSIRAELYHLRQKPSKPCSTEKVG